MAIITDWEKIVETIVYIHRAISSFKVLVGVKLMVVEEL